MWAANLAALELHVPQWTIGPTGREAPDRLVLDLDPGTNTTIVECCRAAERLHDLLVADGLDPTSKTSGSKGLQVYAGIHTTDAQQPSRYAKTLAEQLTADTPDRVVAKMAKNLRRGKVFISTGARTTPPKRPSPRTRCAAAQRPTISTPITWAEVRDCRRPEQLIFTADDVLRRLNDLGDLLADLAATAADLSA